MLVLLLVVLVDGGGRIQDERQWNEGRLKISFLSFRSPSLLLLRPRNNDASPLRRRNPQVVSYIEIESQVLMILPAPLVVVVVVVV